VNTELSTGVFSGSFLDYSTGRPQYVANLDGNYFVSNALGGDHEFKYGFQYKKASVDSFTTYGGDVWKWTMDGEAVEAWMIRPGATSYEGSFLGLHFQDVYTRNRLTLKLAARFDRSRGQSTLSQIPAHMVIPDRMPAIDFPGLDPVNPWNSLSPRVGLTYDLTGDGKTIMRANYARYYDSLIIGTHATWSNAAATSWYALPWTDLDGDTLVDANELDYQNVLWTDNFDPENPAAAVSPNVRDPDTSPPKTDEFIVGMEHELIPDFSLGVNYIYKYFSNMLWEEWPYDTPSAYDAMHGLNYPFPGVPTSAFVPTSEQFEGRTINYYELAPGYSYTGDLLTNRPGYNQKYHGLEITGAKRLSNRWMMNFGITYNT
jgi:hypothetical protein